MVLNACNASDASQHPSFAKIERFMKAEKGIERFRISRIRIDDVHIWESRRFNPDSSAREARKITASYDLTLENSDKAYKSKAEVTSLDSVNWEITSLSITNQTDSIRKHFEETITWKYPVSFNRYQVHLKITD